MIYLDLSWNKLHYTREEVGLIRKYLPAVKSLNLKHNPWLKVRKKLFYWIPFRKSCTSPGGREDKSCFHL